MPDEERRGSDFPIADGRRSSDYVSRQTFMICGIIMSIVMTVTLVAVVLIALTVNDIQNKQIDRNSSAITRLNKVTNDLKILTHPTVAQYRHQLADGIKRCAAEPLCRQALRDLTK